MKTKYNRENRTDRLNKACKDMATWVDTKMYDRFVGFTKTKHGVYRSHKL